MNNDDIAENVVKLTRELFISQLYLSDDIIQDMSMTERQFEEGSMYIANMHMRMWIHKMSDNKYTHPASWWDGFKDAYFPSWLKKLFPVKMKMVTFGVAYPNYKHFPADRFGNSMEIIMNFEEQL